MQAYTVIDQKIHQLSQLLAKVNRSYRSPKADDSHTNLYFDSIANRIYGRWISRDKGKIIFTLHLDQFQLEWLDENLNPLQTFPVEGKTFAQLETEIDGELPKLGLTEKGFATPLHYEIPLYDFMEEPFTVFPDAALSEWKDFRALANQAAGTMLGFLQVNGEIRIWPHHFDTGIYVVPQERIGLGFGWAMEDSMVGMPYFYLSAYGLEGTTIDYKALPKLDTGKWIIGEHWKGGVLSMDALKGLSLQEQGTKVSAFIQEACSSFFNQA